MAAVSVGNFLDFQNQILFAIASEDRNPSLKVFEQMVFALKLLSKF